MTHVRFGPFVIAMEAGGLQDGNAYLRAFAGRHSCTTKPDFRLSMVPDATCADPLGPFPADPMSLARPVYDPARRRFVVRAHRRFFLGPVAAVWQALLYRVFATMSGSRGLIAGLAHGAAVRHGPHTIVLLGPSGMGKTTAARTAEGPILHDDQIILGVHNRTLFVDTPPGPAAFSSPVAGPRPVDLVCLITRGAAPALRPLGQGSGMSALLSAVVPPFPIGGPRDAPDHGDAARICLAIHGAAPPYEFVTDLAGACWKLVDRHLRPSRSPADAIACRP